jgi:hypothetical protein
MIRAIGSVTVRGDTDAFADLRRKNPWRFGEVYSRRKLIIPQFFVREVFDLKGGRCF